MHLYKYLHSYVFSVSATYITTYMIILFQIIDVLGRKKAIDKYLEKIKFSIDSIDDPNTLDRILALLMKADTSTLISDSNPHHKFDKKDHFAPRQKNEIQLRFTKTSENPGRKQKNIPLRYTENGIWQHYRLHKHINIHTLKNEQLK